MPSQLNPPASSSLSISKPQTFDAWIGRPDMIFRAGMVLIVALYLRTILFDFVYDDLTIPLSPWIQSWHGMIDVFKHGIFAVGAQAASSYYRPLATAFIVLVARATPGTPGWFHLAALIIELVVYVLSYSFGRLFFEDDRLAALTAVLFALHPTKVETIAWIGSSGCDGQAAIYFFAVLICYLKWWKSRKPAWMLASVVSFAAAMFTKETMVVLPLLVATHYFLVSARGKKWSTASVVSPYAVVLALYAIARHAVIKPLPQSSIAVQPILTAVNLWSAPSATWWYLKQLLFPYRLSILYDWTPVPGPSLQRFALPLAALLTVALAAAWILWRGRSWRTAFLTVWFVLTLAPPILMAPGVTVHDRYLQLPSYSFCALIAYCLLWTTMKRPQWRAATVAVTLLIVAAWSVGSWHESGYWDNSVTLWSRAVQVAPHNVNARVELARLYASNDIPAAIRVLDDGIRLLPESPGLWRTRGLLQFNAGEYAEARTSLLHALEVSARFSREANGEPTDVTFGRATAAFFLGQIDFVAGDYGSADRWLRTALDIDPDNPDYARVMVTNLRKLGQDAEADRYQKVVESRK